MQSQLERTATRNFLKPLVNPENARLDIVAVHGLNATDDPSIAYQTWTAPNGSMWLKDFLPIRLPNARILLFGYNSNVAFEASAAGIDAHAQNLLNWLKMRRKDLVNRPIIFICYSLGGIIAKEALILAKLDRTYSSISSSSYGIVFFGTPHQGGDFENLGNIAASIALLTLRNPQNALIEALRKESLFNDRSSQYFRHQLEEYRVITFYETLGIGDCGLIVDQKSAKLGLSGARETQIALDADHLNLCKFGDGGGDDYELVVDNICELVDKVLEDASVDSQATLGSQAPPYKSSLTAQARIFKVPDLLHRHFTGRVEQLQTVHDILGKLPSDSASKRVAIFGMPGVGKTQIALKFAQQNRNLYTNVFYIHATDREQIINDFETIHSLLCLTPAEEGQERKIHKVVQWLTNNSGWLLLFDNVVRVDVVQGFLPSVGDGVIIFTMRSESAAQELGLAGKLELFHMDEAEGVELVLKVSELSNPAEKEKALALQLHHELGGLPLALEQVATLSNHRRWTMEKSLDQVRLEKIKILKWVMPENRVRVDCYTIFHLAIQGAQPTAIMLLKIISHFDHQNVTPEIFDKGRLPLLKFLAQPKYLAKLNNSVKWLKILFSEAGEIENAISTLQISALIRRLKGGNIWMHDLFRDLSSDLISTSEEKILTIAAIVLAGGAFRDSSWTSNTQILRETLTPHIINAIRKAQLQELGLPLISDTAQYLGWFFIQRGRYSDAQEWGYRALDGQEKALGKEHPKTLGTVHNIATAFSSQGQYEKALEWYHRSLDGKERALGKEHPNTLMTVHAIAIVFKNQGQYEKALEWYHRSLDGKERALGKEHPHTLGAIHNIATVFGSQGQYEKALEWYHRSLDGQEKALGKEHPETLGTVHNIAIVFKNQGQYGKALTWYHRSLDGQEMVLGKGHPDTLMTVHDIATVFRIQGQYGKALTWYHRSLDGQEMVLGKEHPHTLLTIHNIATVFSSQGQYEKALEWYHRSLDGQEVALGKEHPHTLGTVHDIATVFLIQEQYEKALEWYHRSLDGNERALGKEHPNTLMAVHNIAIVFLNQEEYEKALEWSRRALDGREKVLGKEHPSTLRTVTLTHRVYTKLNLLEKAAAIRQRFNGYPYPTV